jgi:hypothetical protein
VVELRLPADGFDRYPASRAQPEDQAAYTEDCPASHRIIHPSCTTLPAPYRFVVQDAEYDKIHEIDAKLISRR